jgi:hypothetical protein
MSLLKDKIEITVAEAELNTQQALRQFPPLARWLLILAILAIIPAYFISKSLALKYWEQRYKAAKITAKPSFTDAKALEVTKVVIIPLTANSVAAVVSLRNENVDLSLEQVPYIINFYDVNKDIVSTIQDKFFLLPNEEKYLIVPKVTSSFPIVSGEIQIPDNLPWKKKINLPQVNLLTSVPVGSEQSSPPAYAVDGSFTNNSPYSLKQVRLYFILKNPQGEIVGVSQRDEFSVNPFERRSFKQLWPDFSPGPVATITVLPETNTLDKANISIPDSTGSASDLSRPVRSQY